jgi:hypothetical protein
VDNPKQANLSPKMVNFPADSVLYVSKEELLAMIRCAVAEAISIVTARYDSKTDSDLASTPLAEDVDLLPPRAPSFYYVDPIDLPTVDMYDCVMDYTEWLVTFHTAIEPFSPSDNVRLRTFRSKLPNDVLDWLATLPIEWTSTYSGVAAALNEHFYEPQQHPLQPQSHTADLLNRQRSGDDCDNSSARENL